MPRTRSPGPVSGTLQAAGALTLGSTNSGSDARVAELSSRAPPTTRNDEGAPTTSLHEGTPLQRAIARACAYAPSSAGGTNTSRPEGSDDQSLKSVGKALR